MVDVIDAEQRHAVEDLVRSIAGRTFGGSTVEDAAFDIRADSDDAPSIFIELKLGPPPAEAVTWPMADLRDLRAHYRAWLRDAHIGMPVYLRLEPSVPEVAAPEDVEGEPGEVEHRS